MKKFSSFLVVLLLMLASFTAGVEYPRGDVNYDGQVNVTDVTCLINYLLTDAWPEEPVTPQTETFTVNGVTFKMVAVEGGTFMMGASDDDTEATNYEKPAHQVTLSSYSIGETEVTQALWLAVMDKNPSRFTGDLQRPVEQVTWEDCQTFITKLNELTGRTFRLPTEAEWEFAARGGNLSHGYKYSGSDNVDDVSWHHDNSGSTTHAVATKAPNELGIYDMSGNIYEWCNDRFNYYTSYPQTNPVGPSTGLLRVYRGGCWGSYPIASRVTYRYHEEATISYNYIGLRLAL